MMVRIIIGNTSDNLVCLSVTVILHNKLSSA